LDRHSVCTDDARYPDSLTVLAEELKAHPSAVMAVSSGDVIDATGRAAMRNRGLPGLRAAVTSTEAIRRTVLAGTNIFGEPPSALFRRTALVAAGGWHTVRFSWLLDPATYCEVLLRGSLVAVPRPPWAFRISDSQESVQQMRSPSRSGHWLYEDFADRHPEMLDRHHVPIGNARAHLNAIARRIRPDARAERSHGVAGKTNGVGVPAGRKETNRLPQSGSGPGP
jgi:hypothetical protein